MEGISVKNSLRNSLYSKRSLQQFFGNSKMAQIQLNFQTHSEAHNNDFSFLPSKFGAFKLVSKSTETESSGSYDANASSQEKATFPAQKLTLTKEDLENHKSGSAKKFWSQGQDQTLVYLAEKNDCDWDLIARLLPGRNKKMCYSRYKRVQLEARDNWKPRDNAQIKKLYQKQKLTWREISFYFPNRSAKQIREHYLGYLRPNLVATQWTVEQELKLVRLYNERGKKWKEFEKQFEGRTQNHIKNRFYGRLLKLQMKKQGLEQKSLQWQHQSEQQN